MPRRINAIESEGVYGLRFLKNQAEKSVASAGEEF
jgi:hypothetical protein